MNQINECCKEQDEAPASANRGASCLICIGSKNDNRKKRMCRAGLNGCFHFVLQETFDTSIRKLILFRSFFSLQNILNCKFGKKFRIFF